jgi:hypothetical protein
MGEIRNPASSIIEGVKYPPTPIYSPLIPYHLRRSTLRSVGFEEGRVPHHLFHERSDSVEERGKLIISMEPDVERVYRNQKNSREDAVGHDLTLILKDSPVRVIWAQMKPQRGGVVQFKQEVRDNLAYESPQLSGAWTTEMAVHERMTDLGIALLNGGETKSDKDIIESYRPQKKRILDKVDDGSAINEPIQYQIWPWVPKAVFTQPFQ